MLKIVDQQKRVNVYLHIHVQREFSRKILYAQHPVSLRTSLPDAISVILRAHVKKSKRGACEQKAATVLPNRTAAA